MTPDVAIVFGTYNRRALLAACVESIRLAVGALTYRIIVVDGGSTDGSLPWLCEQPDVDLIEQGELLGAVAAFNAGFARAVDLGSPFVCQFNDDLSFVDGLELERAVTILRGDPGIGAVAFASDRYSPGDFGFYNMSYFGRNYANQGLFRREAGMAAARFFGDSTGKTWWPTIHKTYASDTELGCAIWRLGWTVHEAADIRVHDGYAGSNGMHDSLRQKNLAEYKTADLFHSRWGNPASLVYNRTDAERWGGLVR